MFKMAPEDINIQSSANSQMVHLQCKQNNNKICMSHIPSSFHKLRPEST